jgi:hypothetical protein
MKYEPGQRVIFETSKGWIPGMVSHINYPDRDFYHYCIIRIPDKRRFHKEENQVKLDREYYLNLI